MKEFVKRHEVDPAITWDLSSLFTTEEEVKTEVDSIVKDVEVFVETYENKLESADDYKNALDAYQSIAGRVYRVGSFGFLHAATDSTDNDRVKLSQFIRMRTGKAAAKMEFLEQSLREESEELLNELKSMGYDSYIKEVLRQKERALSSDVENALKLLSPITDGGEGLYNRAKLADLRFEPFTVNGKAYPMSFGLFEGHYEGEKDTDLRRAAFDHFYEGVGDYRHTIAAILNMNMQKDKIISELRGFDSVIDYLLFNQNVSRELYERQLKGIMNDLAPIMRRYAKIMQKEHGLEEMTFADLLLSLPEESDKRVSVEEAKEIIMEALKPLGEEYGEILRRAFTERWIDFAENEGKSTGAFCASPYGAHPYILISWSGSMSDLFVLAHELGHAGHFAIAQNRQQLLDTRPSLYLIEAPSTTNELFLAKYLLEKAESEQEKRTIYQIMIARTYYHNFVTHGIEGVFQNKCYEAVDRGEALTADQYDQYFRETLEEFWGDAVTIQKGAERTWMRQPHYYSGLYSYTYSAGLTLGTEANRLLQEEGDAAVKRWISFLEAGGTKDVLGLAKLAGVDLSTDAPLKNTMKKIETLVDGVEGK